MFPKHCPVFIWGAVSVWQFWTSGLDSCFNHIIPASIKIPRVISSVQRRLQIFKRLRVVGWGRYKNQWPEGTWGEDACVRSWVFNIHKTKRTKQPCRSREQDNALQLQHVERRGWHRETGQMRLQKWHTLNNAWPKDLGLSGRVTGLYLPLGQMALSLQICQVVYVQYGKFL